MEVDLEAVLASIRADRASLEARIAELDAMEKSVQVTASAIAKYGMRPPAASVPVKPPTGAPASAETGMSAADAAIKVLHLDNRRSWTVNDTHTEAIGRGWVPPTTRRDAMKVALMRVHRRYPDQIERHDNPVSYRWRDDPPNANGSGQSHTEDDMR